jgi:hypothetical protein
MFRDGARVAFAASSRGYVQIVGGAMTASSCCSPDLRRDLAFQRDQRLVPGGVILLTTCESADILSAPAARRPDHMIGPRCLRSLGDDPRDLTGAACRMLRQICGASQVYRRKRNLRCQCFCPPPAKLSLSATRPPQGTLSLRWALPPSERRQGSFMKPLGNISLVWSFPT